MTGNFLQTIKYEGMKTLGKTIKETGNTLYVFVNGKGLNKGLNFLMKYNKAIGIAFDSIIVTDIAEARRISKEW